MESRAPFRNVTKPCSLLSEAWQKKRNTKENEKSLIKGIGINKFVLEVFFFLL